ncbi:MAG: NADH-quinone oxidoreductase subunit NuoH [Pirellulaceae bacterium]|nr:NADH-quinone oxidoreductase subunit NuoH [Pirellulaceae bacterium]
MAHTINQLCGLDIGSWFGYVVTSLIHCVILLHVVAVGALVFIWMERKIAGRIQDRLGPTRVGGRFGWLQTLADGLKLITKEDLIPADADRMLFKVAPYIAFMASFSAFLALPFADGWVGQHVNTAVFFVLAVLGLEVFGVILAGYASGSKWSLFGAVREAAQVVSYEVPLGLCVVVPVFLCGTMNLVTIANKQAGLFTNWLVFHDPFTFCTFWVYFTCATASVNRAPFDLAEAESELVAGFHTEYSGLRWSFFFMAEYGSMFLVSGLATLLFFGGWHGPIPLFGPLMLDWAYAPGGGDWALSGYLANLAGCINFMLKAVVGVTFMIWIRWTFPRLRIDQVITTCLKYCVPIAAACFLGALVWEAMDIPSPNNLNLMSGRPHSTVREHWVLPKNKPATDEETTQQARPGKPVAGNQPRRPANVSMANHRPGQTKSLTQGGDQ